MPLRNEVCQAVGCEFGYDHGFGCWVTPAICQIAAVFLEPLASNLSFKLPFAHFFEQQIPLLPIEIGCQLEVGIGRQRA